MRGCEGRNIFDSFEVVLHRKLRGKAVIVAAKRKTMAMKKDGNDDCVAACG